MKVFYALAQHLDLRNTRRPAFIVADDPEEAILLMKKSVHFWDYAIPPIELTEHGEGQQAVARVLGVDRPTEKGVYPIEIREPAAPG